jgi:hypothetical protein
MSSTKMEFIAPAEIREAILVVVVAPWGKGR